MKENRPRGNRFSRCRWLLLVSFFFSCSLPLPSTENGTLQIFDLDSPDENQVPSNIVLSFANPLISTSFHHSLASLLLVSDSKGISRLINYEDSKDHNSIRTLITFKDPKSLSNSSTLAFQSRNRVEWKRSDSNLLASFNDGDWKVWDLRRLSGGNPCLSGRIYERGTLGGLRWVEIINVCTPLSFLDTDHRLTSLSNLSWRDRSDGVQIRRYWRSSSLRLHQMHLNRFQRQFLPVIQSLSWILTFLTLREGSLDLLS